MADVKKILVVDDHFEMLELLRSMLESSNQDYEVLAVPSAEEGLLELRRTHFDLLITDARLPGMSGFDLIRRIKAVKPDLPSLMITAYSSAHGKQEAADLGIFHYFEKPLDTDEVLAAVYAAMYGVEEAGSEELDTAVPPHLHILIPRTAKRRLDLLRSDTGATGLVLSALNGQVLHQTGAQSGVALSQVSSLAAKTLIDSFTLARELGGESPVTIQYHAGDSIELYLANVGTDYFLAIWFDIKSKRGRMGTIWVFAQRAIRELISILPEVKQPGRQFKPASTAAPQGPLPTPVEKQAVSDSTSTAQEEPVVFDPAAAAEALGLDEASLNTDEAEVDSFWETAVANDKNPMTGSGITFEDAQKQGLVEPPPEPISADLAELAAAAGGEVEANVDLDDFWESAITEEDTAVSNGLTLEEAKNQGLFPTEPTEE